MEAPIFLSLTTNTIPASRVYIALDRIEYVSVNQNQELMPHAATVLGLKSGMLVPVLEPVEVVLQKLIDLTVNA